MTQVELTGIWELLSMLKLCSTKQEQPRTNHTVHSGNNSADIHNTCIQKKEGQKCELQFCLYGKRNNRPNCAVLVVSHIVM